MAKSHFKTKLSRKQKLRNVQVLSALFIISYVFILWFTDAIMDIPIHTELTSLEDYILSLLMVFFMLSILVSPIILLAIAFGLQKGRAKRVHEDSTFVPIQNIDYYRDNLSELNPSLVSLLIDLDIYGNKDIVATLLRIQNKKGISFQGDKGITIISEDTQRLNRSELELLHLIKNNLLDDKKSLRKWKQNRFYDAQEQGYIKYIVEAYSISARTTLLGLSSFIAGVLLWGVFLALELFIFGESVIALITMFVYLFIMNALVFTPFYLMAKYAAYKKRRDFRWERTPLGDEMAEKIAGLSRFMDEFSHLSEAKKEEVQLWDDYLIYAVVLEKNEQIVKDVRSLYTINLLNFNRFIKKKIANRKIKKELEADTRTIIEALCTIPYDYYCFNFMTYADKTSPHLYEQIANIISGNKFDIKSIPIYNDLRIGTNPEDFDYFFDELVKRLKESGFVCDLHAPYGIFSFAENINSILKAKGLDCQIDGPYAKEIYYRELEKMNINDNRVNYGVLIANVTASLLRENELELVALDGDIFAVIPVGLIPEMEEMEDKIQ